MMLARCGHSFDAQTGPPLSALKTMIMSSHIFFSLMALVKFPMAASAKSTCNIVAW